MKSLTEPLRELNSIQTLERDLKSRKGFLKLSGCIDADKAHLIYTIGGPGKSRLIITYHEIRARELYEDLLFFAKETALYPAKDILFYQADIHGNALTTQRIRALKELCGNEQAVVVTTFDALMNRVPPSDNFTGAITKISSGDTLDLSLFAEKLVRMGYKRSYEASVPGEFAVRGGILDIFPLTEDMPVRIELWGDEVDSLRIYDGQTQRSQENIEEVEIFPATEFVLTEELKKKGMDRIRKEVQEVSETLRKQFATEAAARVKRNGEAVLEELEELSGSNLDFYLPYFFHEAASLTDYLNPAQTLVFLDEPARIVEKGRLTELEFRESMEQRLTAGDLLPGQLKTLRSVEETIADLSRFSCVMLSTLDRNVEELQEEKSYEITCRSVNPYRSSFELLVKDLKAHKKKGDRVVLLSGSRTRAGHLAKDLQEEGLNAFFTEDPDHSVKPGETEILYGKVKRGYEYPEIGFVVITETDIFGAAPKKKKHKKIYEGEKIGAFSDLSVGDVVVHEDHGLGIYRGIEKVEIENTARDYIKIEYAGGSNLYVLATRLDKIQKYTGADGKTPRLNKLGGQEWKRTSAKVRSAVKEIAHDLVELYAVRQNEEGHVYGPDTIWQHEFEEMFPFEETEDQKNAIAATKHDMESKKIMDRLICGDVGYGKTEVAIRAAFKAVQEGKQVAYLCPTTILAQQHYNTFTERMKDFPVRIDLLCRFRTAGEQKKTITDLAKGQVDIVIGTHRLLSKDVRYKDLGLLVIDEEQRFGVSHKETIKKMKKTVDVLTLTATPIPRTLHMSLIGIRDMSILEEPPLDRVPIQTYVMEYNEEMVREAITRELARKGQVYYVYNRVDRIAEQTAKIAAKVPDAVVEYAHGQMRERDLEEMMCRFINGEIDVLVSTTIIETGLDIGNVNTIIIQDADRYGLAQLYQLRGRVGRSNRTAYAFLMYKKDKLLKEIAEKRLSAIREFTDLGSGFRIAMRDLEIRGAGNLLGAEQSGHMRSVGYDLYCKMLNEAVKAEKGEGQEERFDTTVDLVTDAFIPADYIVNEFQKMDIYKRIAGIETEEEAEEMVEELIDRFSDPPESVMNLIRIAKLKAKAHQVFLTEITEKQGRMEFVFYEKAAVNPLKIPEFVSSYHGALTFHAEKKAPYFVYEAKNSRDEKKDVLEFCEQFIREMGDCLLEQGR